jgi:hypothetical protein
MEKEVQPPEFEKQIVGAASCPGAENHSNFFKSKLIYE